MKRLLTVCSTVALGVLLGVTPIYAQQTYDFGFGAGISLPVGSTSDGLSAGPHGALSFSWIPAGSPGLGVQLDATYQYIYGDDAALGGFDLNQQLVSGTLSVLYRFPTGDGTRIHPYILGGGGSYTGDIKGRDASMFNTGSETKFGLEGGLGADMTIAPRFALFIEARYHNVFTDGDNFQVIPVSIGGRIGMGNK